MDWACNKYGCEEMCMQVLVGKPGGRRDHVDDRSVDGRIILKGALKNGDEEDMDCIHLVEDRDRWRALVNAVMNLGFHKTWVIS